jgi:hypothetical protein
MGLRRDSARLKVEQAGRRSAANNVIKRRVHSVDVGNLERFKSALMIFVNQRQFTI